MIKKAGTALIVLAALASVFALGAQTNNGTKKTLVMYYSLTGNTKAAARAIAEELNADIIRIEDAKQPRVTELYDEKTFSELKKKPWKLKPVNADFSKYDRILVGAPVWYGLEAPAIDAFLTNADFTGKNVIVFVTLGGNHSDDALKAVTLKIIAKGGKVVSSFSISTSGLNTEEIMAKARQIAKKY